MPAEAKDFSEALRAGDLTPEAVTAWAAAIDAEMAARLGAQDLAALSVRKRIRLAVLTRLSILQPDKDLARRVAVFLARPDRAALALSLVAHTADHIWRAAGDGSADFNWYTKRAILAGVYAATEIAWFGDDTQESARTFAFLDARLENVMQFEKLKARWRQAQPSNQRKTS